MELIIVFAIGFVIWIVGSRVVQRRYDGLDSKEKDE